MDLTYGLGINAGSTVGKLIPVHRGDDRVLQLHGLHGIGNPPGFLLVQLIGHPVSHTAVLAGPSANITQNHEGSGPGLPAFPDVGAGSLLTHGVERLLLHELSQLEISGTPG
jgi:hypothetical protein